MAAFQTVVVVERLAGGGEVWRVQQQRSQAEGGEHGGDEGDEAATFFVPVGEALCFLRLAEGLREPVDGALVGRGGNHHAEVTAVYQVSAAGAAVGDIAVGMVPFEGAVSGQAEGFQARGVVDEAFHGVGFFAVAADFFVEALGEQVVVQSVHFAAVAALSVHRAVIRVGFGDADGVQGASGVAEDAEAGVIDERQAFQVLVAVVGAAHVFIGGWGFGRVAVPEVVDGEDDVAAPRQFEGAEGVGGFFVALVAVQGQQSRCGLCGGCGFRAVEFGHHRLHFFGHEGDGVDVNAAKIAFDAVSCPGGNQGDEGKDGCPQGIAAAGFHDCSPVGSPTSARMLTCALSTPCTRNGMAMTRCRR